MRASSYSFIMWTATQASFITRHVALTGYRDANGLLPTAAARVAAFWCTTNIHTHTHTHTLARASSLPLRKVRFVCRTKWALSLNWFNRCVLTDLRPVGSLFSVYRGVLMCRVRCQRGARSRAHHCAFICRPVLPIKTSQAGTSGASTALLVHVFMAAALPTYCLINERAASSRRTVLYVLQGGEESTHSNTLTALSTRCTAVWWHLRKLFYNTTCPFLYVSVHSIWWTAEDHSDHRITVNNSSFQNIFTHEVSFPFDSFLEHLIRLDY